MCGLVLCNNGNTKALCSFKSLWDFIICVCVRACAYVYVCVSVCVKHEGPFPVDSTPHIPGSFSIVSPLIKVILFTGTQLAPATFH